MTPSSKCVGDLALYLVLKGLKTSDLIDPITQEIKPTALTLDFPQSIVGLLKGELGFPHRGFPKALEDLVLKGAEKITTRAGLVLPPVNFEENITNLSTKYKTTITPEEAMSYLMYPAVFHDYLTRKEKKGSLLCFLPTLVYFYGAVAGDSYDLFLPEAALAELFSTTGGFNSNIAVAEARANANKHTNHRGEWKVYMELTRITPIQQQHRQAIFSIRLLSNATDETIFSEIQTVDVKDTGGVFVFEGPMADPKKPTKEVSYIQISYHLLSSNETNRVMFAYRLVVLCQVLWRKS